MEDIKLVTFFPTNTCTFCICKNPFLPWKYSQRCVIKIALVLFLWFSFIYILFFKEVFYLLSVNYIYGRNFNMQIDNSNSCEKLWIINRDGWWRMLVFLWHFLKRHIFCHLYDKKEDVELDTLFKWIKS